jgi:hypothetical protein
LPGSLLDEQSSLSFIMFKMDSLSPSSLAASDKRKASPAATTTTGTAPYAGFGLS